MPTNRHRRTRQPVSAYRDWTEKHRMQLLTGFDLGRGAWGRFSDKWHPPADALQDMRDAWADLRDEIMPRAKPGTRPVAWWLFDAPEPRNVGEDEPEQLERMGLLTDAELEAIASTAQAEAARRDTHTTGGLPFRRGWAFWRFVSPEPRDESTPEAFQLQALGLLDCVERLCTADPAGVQAGRYGAGLTSRFHYLSRDEREAFRLTAGGEL